VSKRLLLLGFLALVLLGFVLAWVGVLFDGGMTIRKEAGVIGQAATWLLIAVSVPVFVAFGCYQLWKAAGPDVRDERKAAGQCAGCGYDLTGNMSGECPECGEVVR
jgi:hypothetical protein